MKLTIHKLTFRGMRRNHKPLCGHYGGVSLSRYWRKVNCERCKKHRNTQENPAKDLTACAD